MADNTTDNNKSNDIITLKGKQFGRYVEVEVKDFSSATKLIISNEFEIEFDFFKTVDETKQASVGKIVIYGLNLDTVKNLQHEGGEVTLRCGYEQLQIVNLFTAYITRFYTETANNTTITTIECSANILDFYYTGGQYLGGNPYARGETKDNTTVSTKADTRDFSLFETLQYYAPPVWRAEFNYNNNPSDKRATLENYVNTLQCITNFESLPYDELFKMLCDNFGLTMMKDTLNKVITFSFNDFGLMKALNDIETGDYRKVSSNKQAYLANKRNFESLYKTNGIAETVGIVLDKRTGLISNRTEYKIATAYADQQLSPNESETIESMRKRSDKANKKASAEAERKRKAEEKGKEYKRKPEKYSRQKIRVNRLYQRITALLNPNVKPQTIVIVRNELHQTFDKLRVREATFRGNNRRNEWVMDLYCEDTQGTYDADLTAAQVAQLESEYANDMATQGVVNASGSGNYGFSGRTMTNSQVRAIGWNNTISSGAITNPVKAETVEAMKLLDEDGLGGKINAFTSVTGGSHANGTYSHANGYKFDVDLNVGDNVQEYAIARQRVINILDRNGFKYEVYAEKDGWGSLGKDGFRNGGGSHLDIQILGKR